MLGLIPLLVSGCGSGTTQSQATSFCGTLVPALRADQQLENHLAAYAQGYTSSPVSRAEGIRTFSQLRQAFTKVVPIVPPDRRASFESEATAADKLNRMLQTTRPASLSLDELIQTIKPYAGDADANTAYILQRCGGRNAVYGPVVPFPAS